MIEFNFQDGVDGRPLDVTLLPLDPDRFFLADDERDFALVAVRATAAELAPFGFNPLIEAEGKAIIGEYVTIVQHPRGEKKQVALRENKIVDIPDRFLHYAADTEPGSSGSPVFNDQWEVVALHHASVPAPDHQELGGFMNEGIRVSRILKFVREQPLDPPQRALADQLIAPDAPEAAPPVARDPARRAGARRGAAARSRSRCRSRSPSASAAASRRASSCPRRSRSTRTTRRARATTRASSPTRCRSRRPGRSTPTSPRRS